MSNPVATRKYSGVLCKIKGLSIEPGMDSSETDGKYGINIRTL